MKEIILIVGRSGAGKDTYAGYLNTLGLEGVKSYTTRPRRFEKEDTHIFISKEEAKAYTERVATTKINGYEYFATKQQLEKADYYIIDPNGIAYLSEHFPEIKYRIVYIYADYDTRMERAMKRGNAKEQQKVFIKRDKSESLQFDGFEQNLLSFNNITLHNTANASLEQMKQWAIADSAYGTVTNVLDDTYTSSSGQCYNAINKLKRLFQ